MKTGGAVFQSRAWSRWPVVVALCPVERALCSGETLTSHRLGWSTPNSERPPLSSSGVFPSFHRIQAKHCVCVCVCCVSRYTQLNIKVVGIDGWHINHKV